MTKFDSDIRERELELGRRAFQRRRDEAEAEFETFAKNAEVA